MKRFEHTIRAAHGIHGKPVREIVKIARQFADTTITVYNEWHTAEIKNIEYNEGDTIAVGIYVKCAGPSAWGKIDDAMLNSVTE